MRTRSEEIEDVADSVNEGDLDDAHRALIASVHWTTGDQRSRREFLDETKKRVTDRTRFDAFVNDLLARQARQP